MEASPLKKYAAEAFGTFVLTLFGCGSAAIAGATLGTLGIAMAFGLSIVAMAFVIGNVSGCHINPYTYIYLFLDKRLDGKDLIGYWIAQFIGGIVAAAVLMLIINMSDLGGVLETGLGCDGYDAASAVGLSMAGAFIVEVILTCIFVLSVLGSTADEKTAPFAGIIIGLTLAFVHIMGIPPDRHLRQPRPQLRPGAHDGRKRRHDRAVPGVGVHRGPAGGRSLRRRHLDGVQKEGVSLTASLLARGSISPLRDLRNTMHSGTGAESFSASGLKTHSGVMRPMAATPTVSRTPSSSKWRGTSLNGTSTYRRPGARLRHTSTTLSFASSNQLARATGYGATSDRETASLPERGCPVRIITPGGTVPMDRHVTSRHSIRPTVINASKRPSRSPARPSCATARSTTASMPS